MKYSLQELPFRLRFAWAALAMLGAMWAAVDLHQHGDGFHAPAQCLICSLEESVTSGLVPQAEVRPLPQLINFAVAVWKAWPALSVSTRTVSIRAPPFA
ncbi:MAG: hypothetical protein Q9M12_08140 [Mariprofundus sp.]|nr:hypothetical protein [Mariprofundus sp.]